MRCRILFNGFPENRRFLGLKKNPFTIKKNFVDDKNLPKRLPNGKHITFSKKKYHIRGTRIYHICDTQIYHCSRNANISNLEKQKTHFTVILVGEPYSIGVKQGVIRK